MPDFTNITNASIAPDAPVTAELMTALRDNPLAIAEGADGAPRLRAGFNATAPATGAGNRVVPEWGWAGSNGFRRFYGLGSGSVRVQTSVIQGGNPIVDVQLNGVRQFAGTTGESINFVLNFNYNDVVAFVFTTSTILTVDAINIRSVGLSPALIPWF